MTEKIITAFMLHEDFNVIKNNNKLPSLTVYSKLLILTTLITE